MVTPEAKKLYGDNNNKKKGTMFKIGNRSRGNMEHLKGALDDQEE